MLAFRDRGIVRIKLINILTSDFVLPAIIILKYLLFEMMLEYERKLFY